MSGAKLIGTRKSVITKFIAKQEAFTGSEGARTMPPLLNVTPQCPCIASLLGNAMTEGHYGQLAAKSGNSFRLADRTERLGLDTREAHTLTARLRGCCPHDRCHSPACDECEPVEQLLLASLVEEFVADHEGESSIAYATIIPPNSSVPKGSLHRLSLPNFKRRVRDVLTRTTAHWAVGAVDFSLNEHQDRLFAPHWSPHVHLIVGAASINTLRSEMKAAIPKSAEAPRPVKVTEWDGNTNAFSYIFKSNFNRRISIERAERFNPKTGAARLCRATTYDRLRVAECIELASFLDVAGLGSRLSFRNLRLCKANNSIGLQLKIT